MATTPAAPASAAVALCVPASDVVDKPRQMPVAELTITVVLHEKVDVSR